MIKREVKIERIFKSEEEFSNFLLEDLNENKREGFTGRNVVNFKNFQFDCDIKIPFSQSMKGIGHQLVIQNYLSQNKYELRDCNFNGKVEIKESLKELFFENCNFNLSTRIERRSQNLSFKDCTLKNIDLTETEFVKNNNGFAKLRIKNSDIYNTNFKNAKFNDLVDFYKTTFHENVIFYKTDFLDILVLSAANFKKNLLFTYTLLNDKVIMRSTNFEKGFDLSLSIIKGQLAIFDIRHFYDAYKTVDDINNEDDYEKAVSDVGDIPLKNKIETYRVLKADFEALKNIPESLSFKLLEKRAYKKLLWKQKLTWQNAFDQFTLWLNWWSNKHGTSYSRAFIFILVVGWFFFYLSFIATKSYSASLDITKWEFWTGLKYFVQFLIPTHKFNYIGNEDSLTTCFYVTDFIGRLFVGYGIYQFIQAFRKFK